MTTSNDGWKHALEGNEFQILNALGINPPHGKGHMDCPYPRHGGKSDWRWDQAKGRAAPIAPASRMVVKGPTPLSMLSCRCETITSIML